MHFKFKLSYQEVILWCGIDETVSGGWIRHAMWRHSNDKFWKDPIPYDASGT